MKKLWLSSSVIVGRILAVLAVIGLVASGMLMHETIEYAKNANYTPSCNINPIISCTSAMGSPVAEAIPGLPNPALGLIAFGALFAFAVMLMAGTKVAKSIWLAGLMVSFAGALAVVFLFSYSISVLSTVCPWCFTTWLTTIAVFWVFVTHSLRENYLTLPKSVAGVGRLWSNNAGLVLAIIYAILIFIILVKFNQALFV